MNLVVGGTGMVGTEICRLIAASGKPVKALVRASSAAAKVENLKRLGATVVQRDLRDRGSLKAACSGVNAVISTASAMPFARRRADGRLRLSTRDGQGTPGRKRDVGTLEGGNDTRRCVSSPKG